MRLEFVLKMKFVFLIVIFLLAGCSSMNSDFDCPSAPGVMCKSLDQVNSMVDKGQIGKNTTNIFTNTNNAHAFSNSFKYGDKLRYGESVARIWIAPYEDTSGNYHQESVIYSIAQQGHWLGTPPQALIQD